MMYTIFPNLTPAEQGLTMGRSLLLFLVALVVMVVIFTINKLLRHRGSRSKKWTE